MKITPKHSKIYKPEILSCAKCGTKLKYCHTLSDKVVQFTSGKYLKIVNRGYKCPICNDNVIYFSQTANKIAFKGCTYSAKIMCMIDYYKNKKLGREEICDYLNSKNIEISDRNVDILYKKFKSYLEIDKAKTKQDNYNQMMNDFSEIRLSIDLITIEDVYYILIYNYFTGSLISIIKMQSYDEQKIKQELSYYVNDSYNIKVIASIRNINSFIPLLKSLAPSSTKFVAYSKF